MQPRVPKIFPLPRRATQSSTVGLAFAMIKNGVVNQVNQDVIKKIGNRVYDYYVEKVQGYTTMQRASGNSGGGKGGFVYKDPITTNSNRVKFIFAFNNDVFMYIVDTDSLVFLRNVSTSDSKTITYLSGEQSGKNAYFVIGDTSAATTWWKYSGTTSGTIASVADNGSGKARFTDVAHGLTTGNTVTISGCTDPAYNGEFIVTVITADTFDTIATYTANDTGTWTGETITVNTSVTALNASRLLAKGDSRMIAVNTGTNSGNNQYSYFDYTNAFSSGFTSGANPGDGGRFSGNVDSCTAVRFAKGYTILHERSRTTVHKVQLSNDGTIKIDPSIQQDLGVQAGTPTDRGSIVVDDTVYFVEANGTVNEWFITQKYKNVPVLNDLTANFKPFLENYGFEYSAIGYDRYKKLLLVTCSSLKNQFQDRILIYNFLTKTWSIDEGKQINQFFYDEIGQQMYGIKTSTPEIVKIFDGTYQNDSEGITLDIETYREDMQNIYNKKQYYSASVEVGAEAKEQEFIMEKYINDNTTASNSETFSMDGKIIKTAYLSGSMGSPSWGAGTTSGKQLVFKKIFTERCLPDFDKVSIRIKETSGYRSVVYIPKIEYRDTMTPLMDFSN